MLATGPAAFAGSQNVESLYTVNQSAEQSAPYSMTNKGLSITLPLLYVPSSVCRKDHIFMALLKCKLAQTDGRRMGIFFRKISSKGVQYAHEGSQHWVESAPNFYDEITTIYVKQSWGGFLGFWGILQMATDIIDSSHATLEGQDGQSRHETSTSE